MLSYTVFAQIVIGQAVGTKEALYGRAASTMDIGQRSAEARASFQVDTIHERRLGWSAYSCHTFSLKNVAVLVQVIQKLS